MALTADMRRARRPPGRERPRAPLYRPQTRQFAGMFVIHFAIAAVVAALAVAYPSAAWAYVALAIFTSMCFGLLRYSPATFLLFVPLLALRITEFLSGAAIESGAYMKETAAYGHPTGAFTRLLLIYLLFFATATFVTESAWPRLRRQFIDAPERWAPQARLIWNVLLFVAIVCSLYLLRLGINNGFPLFTHVNRFDYLEAIDSPYYNAFIRNRLVMVPFLGALFSLPAYRWRAAGMLFWLLATSILFGEKFTSLLMILSMFAVPAGLVHIAADRPIPLKVIGFVGAAIIVITVPAVLVAYGGLNDMQGAVRQYGERVALQGQLWFRADERFLAPAKFDDMAIGADMQSWINPAAQEPQSAGTRFGLYYVMEPFTPTRLLGWTMEAGNGFVFALYPYLMMTTGIIGLLIVSSLLAAYHALVMRLLSTSLAEASWLASVVFGRIVGSLYAGYSTGYLWNMFGSKTLATLALGIFLLWETGRRKSVSRRLFSGAARQKPQ